MMKKKVTLKDIAEYCDLAATTVSRILRGKSTYCSAAKIELVKRIAAEWDYRPNIGYNIMTGRETNIAAIIFSQARITQDDQCHRFYMQLAGELDERHFASYTAIMDGNLKSQLSKIRELDERGCRYYIFIGSPAYYEEIFAFLERMKRNYVGYNCRFAPRRLMSDQPGMLLEFSRIAAVNGAENFRIATTVNNFNTAILPRVAEPEKEDFRRCLFEIPPIGLVDGDSRKRYFELGAEIMDTVLKRDPDIDAIAFSSDFHVFGADMVLQKRHKRGKIQLFGTGDSETSKFVDVPFITARFDVENAAGVLLEQLGNCGEWEMWLKGDVVSYNIKNGE